jgi:hypothetical protein
MQNTLLQYNMLAPTHEHLLYMNWSHSNASGENHCMDDMYSVACKSDDHYNIL